MYALQLEGFVKIAFSVDYKRFRGYSAGVKRTDRVSNIVHQIANAPPKIAAGWGVRTATKLTRRSAY